MARGKCRHELIRCFERFRCKKCGELLTNNEKEALETGKQGNGDKEPSDNEE